MTNSPGVDDARTFVASCADVDASRRGRRGEERGVLKIHTPLLDFSSIPWHCIGLGASCVWSTHKLVSKHTAPTNL